jgi:hypothetical protein
VREVIARRTNSPRVKSSTLGYRDVSTALAREAKWRAWLVGMTGGHDDDCEYFKTLASFLILFVGVGTRCVCCPLRGAVCRCAWKCVRPKTSRYEIQI